MVNESASPKHHQSIFDALAKRFINIQKFLAAGGYGRVYKGLRDDGREVAIKVFDRRKIKSENYFESEVSTLLRFKELNVTGFVTMIDSFIEYHHPFIVFELLGKDLSYFMASRSCGLTLQQVRVLMKQVFTALHSLHKHNLVHMDVKPSNIAFVGPPKNMSIKILDVGLVSTLLFPSHMYGTRSYRAPELAFHLTYDQKVDIWSAGCVMVALMRIDRLIQAYSDNELRTEILRHFGPLPQQMEAQYEKKMERSSMNDRADYSFDNVYSLSYVNNEYSGFSTTPNSYDSEEIFSSLPSDKSSVSSPSNRFISTYFSTNSEKDIMENLSTTEQTIKRVFDSSRCQIDYDDRCFNFLLNTFELDPSKRISAEDALRSSFLAL